MANRTNEAQAQALLVVRTKARQEKNYVRADDLRSKILSLGFCVEDVTATKSKLLKVPKKKQRSNEDGGKQRRKGTNLLLVVLGDA